MASKSSGGGRKGLVKWNDEGQPLHWQIKLPTVLDREKNYYERQAAVGEPEIDNVVRTWFKVYHSLVWLVAATNRNCYGVNSPFTGTVECDDCSDSELSMGEEHCLKNSHLVPAFSPAESGCEEDDENCHDIIYDSPVEADIGDALVGNEVRKGWIFQLLKDKFDERHSASALETFGRNFAEQIYQEVGSETLLQRFLTKFKQLSSDFDTAACLDSCLESRSEMGFDQDDKENIYIDEALKLIINLWNEQQLKTHLDEMRSWVAVDSGEPAGSQGWLQTKLNLMSIEDQIATLFNSVDLLEARKKVSTWTAILEINATTFDHIYDRFVMSTDSDGISHGLEAVIEKLATGTSAQQEWNDLLCATSGAVAWQIFHQADLAARHVLETLQEVGLNE